jgi:hypothetical protein
VSGKYWYRDPEIVIVRGGGVAETVRDAFREIKEVLSDQGGSVHTKALLSSYQPDLETLPEQECEIEEQSPAKLKLQSYMSEFFGQAPSHQVSTADPESGSPDLATLVQQYQTLRQQHF